MSNKNVLNILNGQAMYDFFMQHHVDENNVYAPFNEAMCVGEVCIDVFSSQFNQHRCNVHHITIGQYTELVLNPLQPLFNNQFMEIVLWLMICFVRLIC